MPLNPKPSKAENPKPLKTLVGTLADWLEHVLETGADGYLHTPEAGLHWAVRAELDINLVLAAVLLAPVLLCWLALRRCCGRRTAVKQKSL